MKQIDVPSALTAAVSRAQSHPPAGLARIRGRGAKDVLPVERQRQIAAVAYHLAGGTKGQLFELKASHLASLIDYPADRVGWILVRLEVQGVLAKIQPRGRRVPVRFVWLGLTE